MKPVKLDKSYSQQVKYVFGHCFDVNMEDEEHQFFLNHDQLWQYFHGWLDGDKLVSTYISFGVEVKIRNRVLPARYLDGVATLPEYRGKGLARKHFLADIKRCQKEGIPLLLLDPFKHSFYRKWGFEIAFDCYKLEAGLDFLSREGLVNNYTVQMDYLKENEELQKAYLKARKWLWENSRYNEMRMPAPYEQTKFHRKKLIISVAFDKGDEPRGYILYTIDKRNIKVHNFRFITLNAFYALKNHLLSYTDQVKKVNFACIPGDFPVDLLVSDYWKKGEYINLRLKPTRMLRIVDPVRLIKELAFSPPARPITILIRDELFQPVVKAVTVFPDGKVEETSRNIKPKIEIKISDLVPLLTGRSSAAMLYRMGKIKIPGQDEIFMRGRVPEIIATLDKMFPPVITFNAEEW